MARCEDGVAVTEAQIVVALVGAFSGWVVVGWMVRMLFRYLADGTLVTQREMRDRDAELARLRAAIDVRRESDSDTLAEVARYLHALVEARPPKEQGS